MRNMAHYCITVLTVLCLTIPSHGDGKDAYLDQCQNMLTQALIISPSEVVFSDQSLFEYLFGHSLISETNLPFLHFKPALSTLGEHSLKRQREVSSKVAAAIKGFQPKKEIRTLIYPAAGFDSASPFRILPELLNVIAVDSHPFHSGIENTPIVPSYGPGDQSRGFTLVSHVTANSSISTVVLGRLILQFPNIRIHKIVGVHADIIHMAKQSGSYDHGIIIFDNGPQTPLRTYTHLRIPTQQTSLIERSPPLAIIDRLSSLPFQALLRKGSMLFYQQESQAARPLVEALIKNGGLWIDGDQNRMSYQNMTPDLSEILAEWGYMFSDHRRLTTEIDGFGYGNVDLIDF